MPIAEHQMPSCPLMHPAWLGCLSWAIGEPKVMAAFEAATGLKWAPAKTGLDRMIDDATGSGDAFMSSFVDWFNDNVWGDVNEPVFSGAGAPSPTSQGQGERGDG